MTVDLLFKLAFALVAWSGTLMFLGVSKAKGLKTTHISLGVITSILWVLTFFVK